MSTTPRSLNASDRIRRRRVTTACASCRERRVKCDRMRPSCSQCKNSMKHCKYTDGEAPKVLFANERPSAVPKTDGKDASLGTWKSAIDNQAENLKELKGTNDSLPLWALAEAQEPLNPSTSQVSAAYAVPIYSVGDEFMFLLSSKLPSKETCQPFFESFLRGIHPLCPVCHVPTLLQEYDLFWDNLSPQSSVKSLALFLAILYTGAANSTPLNKPFSSKVLEIYDEIFKQVDFSAYHVRNTAASIHFLQAYIIMNTFRASQLAPFFAYSFLPQAIRFAQSLRLHVDQKKGRPEEIEVARRIWWHLVFLDMESTIATGLPPIIHRTGFATQLPSLLDDHSFTTLKISTPQSQMYSPMMIAIQGHYQWASRMQRWFEALPSQDEVVAYKADIERLICLIPNDSDPNNNWASLYLKIQIDRGYCMLGLRFWQPDQYRCTDCHSEVVSTARSFLIHYRALAVLPSHAQFRWFIPGLIQPLHSLVILLMHISTCAHIGSEEIQSRSLIDDILCMRVKHILNGDVVPSKMRIGGDALPHRANPRHLIMVNLRKRVWKKVGWEDDGKGVDPWSGRFLEEPCKMGEGGEEDGVMIDGSKTEVELADHRVVQPVVDPWKDFGPDEGTDSAGHYSLLTGDPLDMFQWDEWEALTSDLFAG